MNHPAALLRRPLRPLRTGYVLAGGVAVVVLGTIAAVQREAMGPYLTVIALLTAAAVGYLAVWVPPSLWASLGLAGTVISKEGERIGLPIGPDRIFMVAVLGSMLFRLPGYRAERKIIWRPTHVILGVLAVYATVSSYATGTLQSGGENAGLFAMLDRLGLVPFLLFTLAPLIFGSERDRRILLTVLLVVGPYLGFTSLFEATGLDGLIWPAYITDPTVGIHFDRARGPFVEAVAMGFGLYGCAVASGVAAWTWRHRRGIRNWAIFSAALCLVGTIFTLTRAIWLATVLASVATLLMHRRTRAMMMPIAIVGIAAVSLALATIAGFADQFEERSASERPLWDRYNTNAAGIRALEENPLFGIGWQRWQEDNVKYLRLSQDYPLTGTTIEIHNVPLNIAVELGLVGLALWTSGLVSAVAAALFRRGPAALDPWRLGMLAIGIHYLIVASFGPVSYPWPNLMLWLWAGICGIGHFSRPLPTTASAPRPARQLVDATA